MNAYKGQATAKVITDLKENKRFLFEKHRFQIVHEELVGRYQTDSRVGLDNQKIQILLLAHGHPSVSIMGIPYVGGMDESTENEQLSRKYWLSLSRLFQFLDNVPMMETNKPYRNAVWEMLDARLSELEEMFKDEASMARWMPSYIDYLRANGVSYIAPGLSDWVPPLPDVVYPETALSKAQFAVLVEAVMGGNFVLDSTALNDLNLRSADIVQAKAELKKRDVLVGKEVEPNITQLVKLGMTPGWKLVVDTKMEHAPWTQIALHFGEKYTMGEAISPTEERLLAQLRDTDAAVNWLVAKAIPDHEGEANHQQQAQQPVEALLPNTQMVMTALLINSAEQEAAKLTLIYLLTPSGLWMMDRQTGKAKPITVDRLCQGLTTTLLNYTR